MVLEREEKKIEKEENQENVEISKVSIFIFAIRPLEQGIWLIGRKHYIY